MPRALGGAHARPTPGRPGRLAVLVEAVAACVNGPRLSLSDVGRRLEGAGRLRYKIKRADRLLGNHHLQGEARSIYAAQCRVLLARIGTPLILIDWSDLKADESLHLLRASLPVGGRSLTLYEEVHPQKRQGNPAVQERFLHRLAALLPAQVVPILIADAGFKVPFFRAVERLGWRWVGRVRGRDQVRLDEGWMSCKTLFARATTTARLLGQGQWVRSNPLQGLFVLVRQPRKGRHQRTRAGTRARSKASTQYARLAKEPWLLVASTHFAESRWSVKRLVRMYRQRMQIEGAFQELAAHLNSEINTLGYPRAALFAFCVALIAYGRFRVHRQGIMENTITGYGDDRRAWLINAKSLALEITQ